MTKDCGNKDCDAWGHQHDGPCRKDGVPVGRHIERVTAGEVEPGQYIIDVDDDSLTTAVEISTAYLADEQDWQHVLGKKGHADVGQFVLAMYNGELYTTGPSSWEGFVWRLVGEDGLPVTQDPTED